MSIPFFSEKWRPASFYDKLKVNMQCKFHTMCLLGTLCCASCSFLLSLFALIVHAWLADIKVKEQSEENMRKYAPLRAISIARRPVSILSLLACRGIRVYEPPRFMTVNQAIQQLLEVEVERKEQGAKMSH